MAPSLLSFYLGAKKFKKRKEKKIGLLHFALYSKFQFDLNKRLIIPSIVAVSQLIPDVVLYPHSAKSDYFRKTWTSGKHKNTKE